MAIPKRSQAAFTLIELLIVVAIIAILAAIAVPNFLEAQVRAKISRVRADLRTIATGVESYQVDNNVYPPIAMYYNEQWGGMWPESTWYCPVGGNWVVTTPIAYLTTWPKDTFRMKSWGGYTGPEVQDILARDDLPMMFVNITQWREQTYATNPNWYPEHRAGYTWGAWSVGPTGGLWVAYPAGTNLDALTIPSYVNPYDPTNGTVSHGGICRLGPGDDPLFN
ncbi:MAG: Type II secretion system protein G precursor [candidate division BRC1 bacterium ADurb.BinA292]|nr:MAG: Type II secretion system protein G precursor [candidate division BRC1 bacterium ADurb.BinA292]